MTEEAVARLSKASVDQGSARGTEGFSWAGQALVRSTGEDVCCLVLLAGRGGVRKVGVASIRNGCAKAATNRKGVD